MPLTVGSVIVPGKLDGVHLGHQALLRHARSIADVQGVLVTALTFDPHPIAVLAPERALPVLTSSKRKQELLQFYGADRVIVQSFDDEFAKLDANAFIDKILLSQLAAKAVVLGADFRFGAGRKGNVELLRQAGQSHGFSVHEVPAAQYQGHSVSSTQVRDALAVGNIKRANALLDRAYDIEGKVVPGAQRGRTLGFPTANLAEVSTFLPAHGVYATVARRLKGPDAPLLLGVTNLGTRPTFEPNTSTIETHLFDFDQEIYGETLRVAFIAYLRPQRSFANPGELRHQIGLDATHALSLLQDSLAYCRAL
jgi:riboflavin kinase/FMN adenylyltransferase